MTMLFVISTTFVAYIIKQDGNRISTALLFSTDVNLSATEICRYYKARFQIEFLFRDAKQYTGLLDCQARCEQSRHFHFNASMTALNLLKMQDRQLSESSEGKVISIFSWNIKKFNEHFIERIFSMLGRFNIFECSEYGHEAHIQLPLLFNDHRISLKIQYYPEHWLKDNPEGVCNDYLGMLKQMEEFVSMASFSETAIFT